MFPRDCAGVVKVKLSNLWEVQFEVMPMLMKSGIKGSFCELWGACTIRLIFLPSGLLALIKLEIITLDKKILST